MAVTVASTVCGAPPWGATERWSPDGRIPGGVLIGPDRFRGLLLDPIFHTRVGELLQKAKAPHPRRAGPVVEPASGLGVQGGSMEPVGQAEDDDGDEEGSHEEEGPEGPSCQSLSGLPMNGVTATEPAELLQFQPVLCVGLVLGCDVVPPFALRAGERQRRSLVRRHCLLFRWVRSASPTC
jgi:hypothetical protein